MLEAKPFLDEKIKYYYIFELLMLPFKGSYWTNKYLTKYLKKVNGLNLIDLTLS